MLKLSKVLLTAAYIKAFSDYSGKFASKLSLLISSYSRESFQEIPLKA